MAQQIKEKQQLEVTVDKRHIIAIGERLYTESVELLLTKTFDIGEAEDKIKDGVPLRTLDFFGESGPECFTEGSVVYINRDHPLYAREAKRAVTYNRSADGGCVKARQSCGKLTLLLLR